MIKIDFNKLHHSRDDIENKKIEMEKIKSQLGDLCDYYKIHNDVETSKSIYNVYESLEEITQKLARLANSIDSIENIYIDSEIKQINYLEEKMIIERTKKSWKIGKITVPQWLQRMISGETGR